MMKFTIFFLAFFMMLAFILMFNRKHLVSKILLVNNFIGQMVCVLVVLGIMNHDISYIDVAFFYVILGSMTVIGFLAYWRNECESKDLGYEG